MKKLLAWLALFFLAVVCYITYVLFTLPDVQALKQKNPTTTALMEQRASEKGAKTPILRTWVHYNDISPNLRNAVLVSEDSAFFQHSGFDYEQIRESARRNWEEKRFVRGASTITQQLAKNLYLSTSKNPLRKLHELFIARELETYLSKPRIFEIYLNVIEWGDGIYGIDRAAHYYFGKSPAELLPEEGAILAVMIPNPRRYNPAQNLAYLQKRKTALLGRLVQYRYLPEKEYEEARLRPIVFQQVSQGRP
jgi:monofunctional biosynthetic peptidoglycan transglycosylase